MTVLNFNPEEERRKKISNLQEELGRFFKGTYNGRFHIDKLYDKGQEYSERLREIDPDFFWEDRKEFSDLKDALEFLERLHDRETRAYHSRKKEVIYYHMIRLS